MKTFKWIGIVIASLVLIVVLGFFYLGQSSQSGTAQGLVEGRLAACPDSPNCVSSEAGTADAKKVAVLPAESWDKLANVLTEYGGTVTSESEDYLSAEFTSSLFGFVDDVEFRLTPEGVHVRSASRVGYDDAGVNRARVEQLIQKLGE